jgi:hypothetical protein
VKEFRWNKEGTVSAGDYIFVSKIKRNSSMGRRKYVQHRIVSTIKTMVFVSERM